MEVDAAIGQAPSKHSASATAHDNRTALLIGADEARKRAGRTLPVCSAVCGLQITGGVYCCSKQLPGTTGGSSGRFRLVCVQTRAVASFVRRFFRRTILYSRVYSDSRQSYVVFVSYVVACDSELEEWRALSLCVVHDTRIEQVVHIHRHKTIHMYICIGLSFLVDLSCVSNG